MLDGPSPRHGLKVAVVTGRHAFDVPAFFDLLRSMPGIEFFPQELENFVADLGRVRNRYDALVFYNYHQAVTGNGQPPETRAVLEELGETGQGIVLWHHGLVAFPGWKKWADLTGLEDRTFTAHKAQTVRVEVAGSGHPITRGLESWQMVDETYDMESIPQNSEILLATDHPLSMRALAWTRQVGRSPVFCCQSGHGRDAYTDPSFRTVLARGIGWAAGELAE